MLELESVAIGLKIVVGMSVTVGLMVGAAILKTVLRNRPRYARPNYRKGDVPPTDKIPCWRLLAFCLVLTMTSCTMLVDQREGKTLEERVAALEERSDAHTKWIIANTVMGVGSFVISLASWYKGEGIIDGMKAARDGH
jgi:hypothetical protein